MRSAAILGAAKPNSPTTTSVATALTTARNVTGVRGTIRSIPGNRVNRYSTKTTHTAVSRSLLTDRTAFRSSDSASSALRMFMDASVPRE